MTAVARSECEQECRRGERGGFKGHEGLAPWGFDTEQACPRRAGAGFLLRLSAVVVVLAAGAPSGAQEPTRPRAVSTRISEPPRIDGRIDDAAWQLATPIGELTQVEPELGAPPSEATEIRFAHDADHLYMAIRCSDREPERIVTTTRERDARLEVDDRVEIVFDTFLDRRNAFFFQINAGGSKGDALITNNGANFNKPWDGIWDGAARVDEQGWSAELALPFKTLNFADGLETWGFNIERFIGKDREEARWANPSREHRLFNIYRAGELSGLAGIRQGIGLDVVPFFVSHWRNERDSDGDGEPDGDGEKTLLGEPGFDLFYKVIPSLTFSLTVNTDFAETEVDQRQINLTRFPLFFPERRDFFLQDSGVFEFGFNNSGGGGGDSALIPFFSRRIGLSADGEEVPILAGAKLTGRAGDYGIGVLDVQTDELDQLDGQNLFVGRLTKNVGEQSTVGGIVTRGNPDGTEPDGAPGGTGRNAVYGVDVTNRSSVFSGDRDLITTGFFLYSDSEDVAGEQSAFGLALRAPGDFLSWELGALEIQEHFDPALGFVPRSDIRRYEGAVELQPRPDVASVRQLEFGLGTQVFTDTDGELETWNTEFQPFGVFFESGDAFRFELEHTHDELAAPFLILDQDGDGIVDPDDVEIPAGEYDFSRARVELETAEKRALSTALVFEGGEFFDGRLDGYGLSLLWQPGPFFNGRCAYSRNDVSLPGGDFDTQIAELRANFSFTPELSWNNFLQWDTESDTFGVQSRLRWIPVPHQEVFLVFNETLESDSSSSAPLFGELSFKITYAIRF